MLTVSNRKRDASHGGFGLRVPEQTHPNNKHGNLTSETSHEPEDTPAAFEEAELHSEICRTTEEEKILKEAGRANSSVRIGGSGVTHHRDLARLLAGSNPQLVDGRLGHVGSLLGVV